MKELDWFAILFICILSQSSRMMVVSDLFGYFCKPFQSERKRCAFREYKRLCFPRGFLSSLAECKQKNVDALLGLESCGWYWFEYYFEWSSFISIHRKIFDGICYSLKKKENMEENGKLNEEKRVNKVETRIIHRSLLQ